MLQLPTPTPPTPEPQIPLSELESLWRAAATETRLLSDGDKLFIVALIVAIAVVIYIWRRPKPVDTDAVAITTLGTTLGRIGTQNENMAAERVKTAEENKRLKAEQDERLNKVLESIATSITTQADATNALKEHSATTQELVKQLMERDETTVKALLDIAAEEVLIKDSVGKIETDTGDFARMAAKLLVSADSLQEIAARLGLRQNELDTTIETFRKQLSIYVEKLGKDAAPPPIPLDDDKPQGKTA